VAEGEIFGEKKEESRRGCRDRSREGAYQLTGCNSSAASVPLGRQDMIGKKKIKPKADVTLITDALGCQRVGNFTIGGGKNKQEDALIS